jgi:hypothetical protein
MVENWLPKAGPAGSAEAHGARIRLGEPIEPLPQSVSMPSRSNHPPE